MQAKDVMRKEVLAVRPEMTLREAADLFVRRRISGAPVVDREGRPVGVLSQTDLVRRGRADAASRPKSGQRSEFPSYHLHDDMMPDLDSSFTLVEPEASVEEAMNPAVLSADEAAPLEQLAFVMLGKRIHRILITRKGKLCGIVTSMDMMRALLPARRSYENNRPADARAGERGRRRGSEARGRRG